MRGKKYVIMGMLVMSMVLSACGSKNENANEEVAAGEITATPVETEEIQATQEAAPTETPSTEETQATEETVEPVETEAPKTEEIKKETKEAKEDGILIYYGDEDAEHIIIASIPKQEVTTELLISELAKKDILTNEVKVNSIKEVIKGKKKTLEVDFNDKFQEILYSQGSAGEYIMMGSVVDTFLKAYGADSMTITSNGNILESGHCIYESEMRYYEPSTKDDAEQVSEEIANALGVEQ